MREIPNELLNGPFTRRQAASLGVTSRMLEGRRFVRVHPRVWLHRDHQMSEADALAAAELALPQHARTTGITRIQQLGLDFGPRRPRHFVVEGDLHLSLDGIFLHRTVAWPPLDEVGVSPAGAFLAYCRTARTLDAIKVGNWLLAEAHVTKAAIADLASSQPWRDGAAEALWVLEHLRGGPASLMESELLAVLIFAGLPEPEINAAPVPDARPLVICDLLYRSLGVAVEYEGGHHQLDRGQYLRDLGRYSWMRDHDQAYVQVTREALRVPRIAVGSVYRALVARGYDGPPPEFGARWKTLFSRLSLLVPRRRPRRR